MATTLAFPTQEVHIVAAEMEHAPWFTPGEKTPTRLARAIQLLEDEHVAGDNGTYHVVGKQRTYTVTTEGCDCEAATKGGETHCYHRVAAQLYARVAQRLGHGPGLAAPPLVAEAEDEDAPPPLASPSPIMAPALCKGKGMSLRSIRAIVADLSRPLPEECVASIERDGQQIPFLHWYDVTMLLNTYAPGWHGAIVDKMEWSREELVKQRVQRDGKWQHVLELATVHVCTVTYRLSIPCLEGIVTREQTGRESAITIAYGDWSSNATAMAFTRAAAMFGVGMWLRDKTEKPTSAALRRHLTSQAWEALGKTCDTAGFVREAVKEQVLHHAHVTEPGRVTAEHLWTYMDAIDVSSPSNEKSAS
jgi:hypothetical protein